MFPLVGIGAFADAAEEKSDTELLHAVITGLIWITDMQRDRQSACPFG
jgi:hypothetical protein